MQEDRRRGSVEAVLSFSPVGLVDRQPALRLATGQAFVGGVNGNRRPRLQLRDKRGDQRGLFVWRTVEPYWHADHDIRHPVFFSGEMCNFVSHTVDRVRRPHGERRQRARQRPAAIADRESHTPPAQINRQDTHRPDVIIVLPNHSVMRNRSAACSVIALVIAIVLPWGSLAARQADRTEGEALSRRAAERLRALHDEADRLASEERSVLIDLRRLEVTREIRAEELRQAEADAAQVATELATLDHQIATLEQQARDDIPDLRARLVSLYKLGSGRYVRLLLSTTDMRRIGQASRLVAVLSDQDQLRLAAYSRRLEELTSSRRALQERRMQLTALRAQAQRARLAAENAVAARNALVREIDQRRDLNAQLAGELMTAQQKLQSAVGDIASGTSPSLPIGPFRGDLDWPVTGTIRQRFGGTDGRRGISNGIDIAAAEGLPVEAIHDGTVAFADTFTGFGRLVIVDHGGQTFSLYGNLRDLAVTRGDRVQRGAAIGSAGVAATGATGLYFELRVDGRPVDPLQWLKKR